MKTLPLIISLLMLSGCMPAYAAITVTTPTLSPSLGEFDNSTLTDENGNLVPAIGIVIPNASGQTGLPAVDMQPGKFSQSTGRMSPPQYKLLNGKKLPVMALVGINTSTKATQPLSIPAGSVTLSGDVTGTAAATVVALVGTSSAANVHSAELAANAATSANTVSTIMKRGSAGEVNVTKLQATSAVAAGVFPIAGPATTAALVNGAVPALELYAGGANAYLFKSDGTGVNVSNVGTSAKLLDLPGTAFSFKNESTAVEYFGGDATTVTALGALSSKSLKLSGSTSGLLTIQPAAVTTSHTLTAPAAQGAAGTALENDGAGSLSWKKQSDVVECGASAGGGATEALTCTGLTATDIILAVTQRVAGANNTAITGYSGLGSNALTVGWTGDPGSGAIVRVTVKH